MIVLELNISMEKYITKKWFVAALVVALVGLRIWDPLPVQYQRLKTFDLIVNQGEKIPSEDIIIVQAGEKTVEKWGQWPFDRRDIAKLIERLRQNGAGAIMLNVLFSEPDRAGGDATLANTLNNNGVIIAQTATTQTKKPDAVRRGVSKLGEDPSPYLFTWQGGLAPLPSLAKTASGVGTLASATEVDGVVRRLPMLVRIGDDIYPNMVMETIRVAAGDPSYQVKTSEAGVEAVRVPSYRTIPTDSNGRVFVRWNHTFKTIEAVDDLKDVKGKTVIVGAAIEGVTNIVATPNGEMWPHEIQAHLLQTVLDGTTVKRFAIADFMEMLVSLALGLVTIWILFKYSIKVMVPYLVGVIGILWFGESILFDRLGWLLDPIYPALVVFITWAWTMLSRFYIEFKQKQQIKKQFGTYLSPALVSQLQKHPEKLALGGDERELSIMFTDVRGFTSISEHYGKDVQGLTKIMNRYMTAMTKKILDNNGTLDKYIGDAQMAFWNAPIDEERHAHMAVKTALEMMESLDGFNREVTAEGIPAFGMGLGINTAAVVVGNMGSDQRFDYTCLGDGVNLASRLEGQSKNYGVRIILGQRTAELVKDTYTVAELDCIAVKGKKEGVNIFTVLSGAVDPSKLNMHANMLENYRAKKFDSAIRGCKALKGEFNRQLDDYYDIWIERCNDMKKQDLPDDWDGVYRATSK
jgi:adenylate cyclase